VSARRKRLIVEGFHAQFVAVQLAWFAILLIVLVGALFAPWVHRLQSDNLADRVAAADQFLTLHQVVWPSFVGVMAAAAAVVISMTHRVAAPLYRFRRVFAQVGEGKLNMRVTLRRRDYLTREASELDAMVERLRTQVREAQTAVDAAAGQLGRMSRFGWLPSPDELRDTQDAIEQAQQVLKGFDTDEPAAGVKPTSGTDAGRDAPEPELAVADRQAGFTVVETLIACGMIGLLVALAAPRYTNALEVARTAKAIHDIRTMGNEIVGDRIRLGCVPDLVAIGRADLLDPWRRPYLFAVIETPSAKNNCLACSGTCIKLGDARKDGHLVPLNSDFDLYSVGKNGETGATLNNPKSHDDVVRANGGGFIGLGRNY
jgi:general secretion pathway protein G